MTKKPTTKPTLAPSIESPKFAYDTQVHTVYYLKDAKHDGDGYWASFKVKSTGKWINGGFFTDRDCRFSETHDKLNVKPTNRKGQKGEKP